MLLCLHVTWSPSLQPRTAAQIFPTSRSSCCLRLLAMDRTRHRALPIIAACGQAFDRKHGQLIMPVKVNHGGQGQLYEFVRSASTDQLKFCGCSLLHEKGNEICEYEVPFGLSSSIAASFLAGPILGTFTQVGFERPDGFTGLPSCCGGGISGSTQSSCLRRQAQQSHQHRARVSVMQRPSR